MPAISVFVALGVWSVFGWCFQFVYQVCIKKKMASQRFGLPLRILFGSDLESTTATAAYSTTTTSTGSIDVTKGVEVFNVYDVIKARCQADDDIQTI